MDAGRTLLIVDLYDASAKVVIFFIWL